MVVEFPHREQQVLNLLEVCSDLVPNLLTLSAHAREGYSSRFACVSLCVSLALKRQDCFDVRDRHQREAGKGAIGLNVADF